MDMTDIVGIYDEDGNDITEEILCDLPVETLDIEDILCYNGLLD